VKAQVQEHVLRVEADLSLLPTPHTDPVNHVGKLLWEFEKKLNGTVDIYKYNAPPLVGECRRRLEDFVRILLYKLSPRFRPFPNTGANDEMDFQEIYLTSIEIPETDLEVHLPRVIYLDAIADRARRYVLL
jgi:hypothetical protein